MQENIMVFDVETTGLPKRWDAPMTDLDNWPRVIQIAFNTYNRAGIKHSSYTSLIAPDGWEVPEEPFWIEHGYSTGNCIVFGEDMENVLDIFSERMQDCSHIVAHNLSFDKNVLGAELIRYGKKLTHRPANVCTKEIGTSVCKIPNAYGSFKWPKLEELHTFLFGTYFEGAHDAGSDVDATARCFFELVKREHITL